MENVNGPFKTSFENFNSNPFKNYTNYVDSSENYGKPFMEFLQMEQQQQQHFEKMVQMNREQIYQNQMKQHPMYQYYQKEMEEKINLNGRPQGDFEGPNAPQAMYPSNINGFQFRSPQQQMQALPAPAPVSPLNPFLASKLRRDKAELIAHLIKRRQHQQSLQSNSQMAPNELNVPFRFSPRSQLNEIQSSNETSNTKNVAQVNNIRFMERYRRMMKIRAQNLRSQGQNLNMSSVPVEMNTYQQSPDGIHSRQMSMTEMEIPVYASRTSSSTTLPGPTTNRMQPYKNQISLNVKDTLSERLISQRIKRQNREDDSSNIIDVEDSDDYDASMSKCTISGENLPISATTHKRSRRSLQPQEQISLSSQSSYPSSPISNLVNLVDTPLSSSDISVNSTTSGSAPKFWTRKEDESLIEAVKKNGPKNWKVIASYVPGRNPTQCQQRWSKVLVPGLRKGPWSQSEDNMLLASVKEQMNNTQMAFATVSQMLGNNIKLSSHLSDIIVNQANFRINWKLISEKIPGRTAKQCRARWVNNLNPGLKKDKWTEEEDNKLLEIYDSVGSKWSYIASQLPGRSENAVKIRYISLRRIKGSHSPLHSFGGAESWDTEETVTDSSKIGLDAINFKSNEATL